MKNRKKNRRRTNSRTRNLSELSIANSIGRSSRVLADKLRDRGQTLVYIKAGVLVIEKDGVISTVEGFVLPLKVKAPVGQFRIPKYN